MIEFTHVTAKKTSTQASAMRCAKLAISLVYYGSREFSRLVQRLAGRSPDRALIILYYHGVPSRFRSNFARQMEAIQRGARVVPASYCGNLLLDKPNVAITFDDAYVSVAENALPELVARGFHATIFVPAGCLGRQPTWSVEEGSLDAEETVMSAEQLAQLPASLVTLGSHTSTHPRLSQADACQAREEIEASRQKLQALTAQDIRLLAFPHGDYNASVVELCKSAGYDYVFSVTPDPVETTDSGFVRGRVKVDPFDWPLEFFLKYRGAYAWNSQVSSFKQKLVGERRRLRDIRRPSFGRQG